MSARVLVESSHSDPQQRARLLAAASPHSSDWLLALPITACGLRLSMMKPSVWLWFSVSDAACVYHILVDVHHRWMPRDFMAWSASRPKAE